MNKLIIVSMFALVIACGGNDNDAQDNNTCDNHYDAGTNMDLGVQLSQWQNYVPCDTAVDCPTIPGRSLGRCTDSHCVWPDTDCTGKNCGSICFNDINGTRYCDRFGSCVNELTQCIGNK